jgi:hypothetical protein
MPTFADHFMAELARSGVLERLKPWGALFVQVLKMPRGMLLMASAIAGRAEENFPSKAYGPYLEAQGFAPFLARGLGSLTISIGTREADEAKRAAPVVEAIRFLSRGNRQRRAILSRAKLVLTASKETSIVDGLFHNAGLHEGEFLRLLQTAIDGGAINRERITTIAAAVAPSVRRARGPKITAASAAHELFLETNASLGLPAGFTWSDVEGKCLDERTKATRHEFDDPRFDPRSARRRVKLRGVAKTSSSPSTVR